VNAPTALEDQLRASLHRQAGQASPRRDAADVRRRVARRRRRRQLGPAVGAIAVIGAGIVAIGRADDGDGRTSTAAEVAGPDGASDGRAFVPPTGPAVPLLALEGAPTVRYQEMRHTAEAPPVVEPEYEFAVGDARLQLHLYPGGADMLAVRTHGEQRSTVSVLGREASLLEYGGGRFRVDVLIGDYVWEFDGEPFGSLDEFLAAVEGVRVVDQATWDASLVGVVRDVFETDAPIGEPAVGAVPPNATAETETTPPAPESGEVTGTTVPAGK
jgi:hypothetical protein